MEEDNKNQQPEENPKDASKGATDKTFPGEQSDLGDVDEPDRNRIIFNFKYNSLFLIAFFSKKNFIGLLCSAFTLILPNRMGSKPTHKARWEALGIDGITREYLHTHQSHLLYQLWVLKTYYTNEQVLYE